MAATFREEFFYVEYPGAEPELIVIENDVAELTADGVYPADFSDLLDIPEGVDVSNIDPNLLPF